MHQASVYSPLRFCGWTAYIVLLVLRVALVLLIQPGYLHPDEFFQSVEIGAGDVYGLDVFRSWEFVNSGNGPLRSIAGLAPLVHLPLWISKHFFFPAIRTTKINGTELVASGGDELITRVLGPLRLQTLLCSLVVDLFILVGSAYLRRPNSRGRCCFFSIAPPIALLLYASAAFGGLLFAGRTLANTWEMASVATFAMLSLVVMRHLQPCGSLIAVTFILGIQAILSGWATFLRCTYPVFIFPLAVVEIYVLLRRYKYRILFPGFLASFLLALTVQACLHIDTVYFAQGNPFQLRWLPDLICIPCRFMNYNSRTDHLSEHGLHPRYLHLLVNVPLIFGPVLGFLALWPPCLILSGEMLIWVSAALPLAFLSSIPHQEARFLLPIVPFVLILVGRRLELAIDRNGYRKGILILILFLIWFGQQICLTYVFGSLHQAGVLTYLKSIPEHRPNMIECPVHVFYHTYMPPRFPLGRSVSQGSEPSSCQSLIDLGGASLKQLEETLTELRSQAVRDVNKQWIVNVVYPGSLFPLNLSFDNWGSAVHSRGIEFGHLSFEDPPSLVSTMKGLAPFFGKFIQVFADLGAQLSIHVSTIRLH